MIIHYFCFTCLWRDLLSIYAANHLRRQKSHKNLRLKFAATFKSTALLLSVIAMNVHSFWSNSCGVFFFFTATFQRQLKRMWHLRMALWSPWPRIVGEALTFAPGVARQFTWPRRKWEAEQWVNVFLLRVVHLRWAILCGLGVCPQSRSTWLICDLLLRPQTCFIVAAECGASLVYKQWCQLLPLCEGLHAYWYMDGGKAFSSYHSYPRLSSQHPITGISCGMSRRYWQRIGCPHRISNRCTGDVQ